MFEAEVPAEPEDRAPSGHEAETAESTNANPGSTIAEWAHGLGDLLGEMFGESGGAILSAVRVGIAIYDRNKKCLLLNPAIEAMFGLRADELYGPDSESFPFAKDAGLDAFLEQALVGESAFCPDFSYYVSKSGSAGWASARFEPVRESNGQVTAVVVTVQDITPLKLANKALGHSEERYRSVVERASDVIYIVSPDYAIISLNQAFDHLTGWRRVDWIGKSFLGLLHPDDLSATAAQFQRVMRGEQIPPFELRFAARNGEYLIGECTAAAQMENGRVVSASGIIRDVTARKRAEEALRATNERFELIVKATNDAVWEWNLVTGEVWWSEGLETLFGYRADDEESQGSRWNDRIHPDDRERVLSGVLRVLESEGQNWFDEYRYQRSNGSYANVLDRGFVLRSEDGTVERMIGAMMDVTYRSSAEEALHLAEEEYRSIFENAVEGIFQSTPEGRFITVNPALVKMLGYESTQDLTLSVTDIEAQLYTDPERRKEFQEQLESQGIVQHFENQVYRKDGSVLWISESVRAVRDAAGVVLYYEGTVEDITSLKLAEKERLNLEEQLLQAQRIESIGLLAGGVAHDFNNLLTAIIGGAQILESRLGSSHPLSPDVRQIVDSGQRAATLTSQLLAFSRRQKLLRCSVNLNDTLSNLMSMLQRIIGDDVEILFRKEASLYPVLADNGQIEQVVMNLAVNARDAMPEGGLLVIATRNVTLDEAYCREHAWARPGKYVVVSVSDDGVGMDAEIQRRIFEPFFTTKQEGRGTGLGLSVVYGIVKQHDGLIHVYSSPDHGTTFRIYLKAHETPATNAPAEPAASLRGGSETVLVAEDEPTLRGLAKSVLEGLGYRVLLAEDGEVAVAAYERAMNEIDLLILDVIMPRMGGREAYERIRALRIRECPVIFMTGRAPEILKDELFRSKSAEIVQKPYQLDEFGRKVREVLDSRPRAASMSLGSSNGGVSDLARP